VKLLYENNILAVPVYERGELIGMIDIYQIMLHTSFFEDHQNFQTKSIGSLVRKITKSSDITIFKHTDTLEKAMKYLAIYGHHRLLLSCPDEKGLSGSLTHQILTQSDVISFCTNNLSRLKDEKLDMSIQGLSLVNPLDEGRVIKITCKDSAFKGFVEMAKESVPAVAVVDEQGNLVTNLSSSDLRGISTDSLSIVNLPVLEFLKKIQKTDNPFHPITAKTNNNLRDLMPLVSISKVHRVWIVNSAMKPIGIITLTDMIRILVDYLFSSSSL